jgi:hypothetical protein
MGETTVPAVKGWLKKNSSEFFDFRMGKTMRMRRTHQSSSISEWVKP